MVISTKGFNRVSNLMILNEIFYILLVFLNSKAQKFTFCASCFNFLTVLI